MDVETHQEWLYLVAIVVWIWLIIALGLWTNADLFGRSILLVPIIVFAISMANNHCVTKKVEKYMGQGNYLSFVFLATIIIINWNKPETSSNLVEVFDDKIDFFKLIIIALFFLLLSLIDIWVPENYIKFIIHWRSVTLTIGLTLITFSLYSYYLSQIEVFENL